VKTLVLAAGRSRRIKPIEDKNFLKFAGKTLLEHQLDTLQRVGLTDIILVGGAHNLAQLQDLAEAYKAQVVEQKNLDEGMAGAVLAAEALVGEETLLIFSSNDVLAQSAFESIQLASQSTADAYLLAYRVQSYFPGGYLKVDGKRITGMVEKPTPGEEPSDLINLVLHLHKKPQALFQALREVSTDRDDRYEVALDALMKSQVFEAVPYEGYWQALKFPWHILDLMQFSLKMSGARIHPSAQIAETALIKGDVVIEEGAKIMDHAVVQGPAYIGKNTVVANNALVRESMIGANSVVGFGTEVARSYVGEKCWFHSNYVGDTVMGDNCSFGAGAVCANLRLDEKEITSGGQASGRTKLGPILGENIRIGVNTSLMPGIRIGSNSMIASGLTLAQDIDPGSFVTGKTELVIKENRAILDPSAREKMQNNLTK
jgi:NDP-sugar pyrophosphorylase family protein